MNYMNRARLHDDIQRVVDLRLSALPPIEKTNDARYKFQWIFYRDKSTGRFDLSNLGWLIKTVEDRITVKLSTDDTFHNFIEHKTVYGGMAEHEHLDLVVIKTDEITPARICDKISAIEELLKSKGIDLDLKKELQEILM
ncbi:MAG: hypothetical protein EKK64_07570 [Neisseriaceae bacterium]|nr:MAG: hypothetical protein EKK64_07570 [Neisseriaceae bacterium]